MPEGEKVSKERELAVHQALAVQGELLLGLEDSLRSLSNGLIPVLEPRDLETADDSNEPRPLHQLVSSKIKENNRRIMLVTENVRDLRDRLEV